MPEALTKQAKGPSDRLQQMMDACSKAVEDLDSCGRLTSRQQVGTPQHRHGFWEQVFLQSRRSQELLLT